MPDSLSVNPLDPPAREKTRSFYERFSARGHEVAAELGTDVRSIDGKFLGFLRELGRFGIFSLGPLTIRLAPVEELVARSVSPATEGLNAAEEATFDEFFVVLAKERARARPPRSDELDVLLTFMRMTRGVPARVFGELGVSPERVEEYVRSGGDEPPELERLYSPEEVAEYLGVRTETVRSWIRSGRLPAQRLVGQRALRVRASDLAAALEPFEPNQEA